MRAPLGPQNRVKVTVQGNSSMAEARKRSVTTGKGEMLSDDWQLTPLPREVYQRGVPSTVSD